MNPMPMLEEEIENLADDEIIETADAETSSDETPIALAPADRKRAVEAMIFAAPAPVATSLLEQKLALTAAEVMELLSELQNDYAARGVQLVERAGQWSFQTAPDLAAHLTFVKAKPVKLSRAAMETLAVIAYHQPLTRTEIENIRGVAIHKGTLDLLLETGWIKPGKRREVPGRPLTWVTANAFLEHFGLATLRELPGVAELKASGLLDRRPAIALVPERDDTPEPDAPTTQDENDLSDFLPADAANANEEKSA